MCLQHHSTWVVSYLLGSTVTDITNKFYGLSSIAFPGFFRVMSVFIIGFLFSGEVAEGYSRYFLIACYINALIGVPVASIILEKKSSVSVFSSLPVIAFLSVFLSSVYVLLFEYQSVSVIIFIVAATFFAAMYETIRQHYMNELEYKPMFFCSLITLLIFSGALAAGAIKAEWLLFYSFTSLIFPLALYYFFTSHKGNNNFRNFPYYKYFDYVAVSALSTSIGFLLPMLAIEMLGQQYSLKMAMSATIVTTLMLLPRFVANGFIKKIRDDISSVRLVSHYAKSMLLVVVISFLAYMSVVILLDFGEYLLFGLLFFAIYLSQLSLPYSCVFTVSGSSKIVLKVNIFSAASLVLFISIFFLFNALNIYTLLGSFVAHQFCRLAISIKFFRKVFADV
jgi:hypothetical protein